MYTLLRKKWSVQQGFRDTVLYTKYCIVRDNTQKSEKHELISAVSRTISWSISESPLHLISLLIVRCTSFYFINSVVMFVTDSTRSGIASRVILSQSFWNWIKFDNVKTFLQNYVKWRHRGQISVVLERFCFYFVDSKGVDKKAKCLKRLTWMWTKHDAHIVSQINCTMDCTHTAQRPYFVKIFVSLRRETGFFKALRFDFTSFRIFYIQWR